MLNHIVIMGRLTRDPELRSTQSGVKVATFTVAVDRDYSGRDGGEKQTDFIDCVAWRQGGEFVATYFHKGSMIVVSGRLQSRKWKDREGNNRVNWEINADSVYFGESRQDSENRSYERGNSAPPPSNGYGNYASASKPVNVAPPTSGFTELDDSDGDLPF